ncbi:MAG: hypothetical protein ACRDD4_00435 [Culicoidibacterales bacterium]
MTKERKVNIYGGGATTNKNGLKFEQLTALNDLLNTAGFIIKENTKVFYDEQQIGWSLPKHELYRFFMKNNINWKERITSKLLPDECFINLKNNTVYIIEKKFQNTSGSVDVKLAACDFYREQYQKLFKSMGYKIEYIYILNDWFTKQKYTDLLQYIEKKGCQYHFIELPLRNIGLDLEIKERLK